MGHRQLPADPAPPGAPPVVHPEGGRQLPPSAPLRSRQVREACQAAQAGTAGAGGRFIGVDELKIYLAADVKVWEVSARLTLRFLLDLSLESRVCVLYCFGW